MKLKNAFLILAILLLCFQICAGQEVAKPILFDKFGIIPLGDLWGRVDNFAYRLSQVPDSSGYVVIYPERNSIKQGFRQERKFKESIVNRFYQLKHFDENRTFIVRSEEITEFKIELWEIPPGVEKPFTVVETWNYYPFDLTKAFIFGEEKDDSAYPLFAPRRYAKLLNEIPNLRGHIVIFNKSKSVARRIMEDWIKQFTEEYKIPRNRLKFFFARNGGRRDIEFWIVPKT